MVVVLTGTYVCPKTKQAAVEKYFSNTLMERGHNHLIFGDLNFRYCSWDKVCNELGNSVHKLASKTRNIYVVAAIIP